MCEQTEVSLRIAYGAMPNRVVHPPHAPASRSSGLDTSLLIEDLVRVSSDPPRPTPKHGAANQQDTNVFSSASAIRDLFSIFGKIIDVQIIDKTAKAVSAIIRYENVESAFLLVSSNGMPVGELPIRIRFLSETAAPPIPFAENRNIVKQPVSRSTVREDDDPFAFGLNHLRPQVLTASPLKANVQPFVPGSITAPSPSNQTAPFSLPFGFAAPASKPVSIRRGSLDVSISKLKVAPSSDDDDAQLAASVEKLLLSGREQEQGETSGSDSSGNKNGSDGSCSRTPPSSPQPAEEGGSSSDHGSDHDKKSGSSDGKSDTVVGEVMTIPGKVQAAVAVADRWSAGNPAAQWVSSAWCELIDRTCVGQHVRE